MTSDTHTEGRDAALADTYQRRDNARVAYATEQRILSVLYRSGGQITSDRGSALKRISVLMATPYAISTVRQGVYQLEASGKVRRDVRVRTGGQGDAHRFQSGARCYGVYMLNPERDRPDQKYLDELAKAIEERSIKAQAAGKSRNGGGGHVPPPANSESLFGAEFTKLGLVRSDYLSTMEAAEALGPLYNPGMVKSRVDAGVYEGIKIRGRWFLKKGPDGLPVTLRTVRVMPDSPEAQDPVYPPDDEPADEPQAPGGGLDPQAVAQALLVRVLDTIKNPPTIEKVVEKIVEVERRVEVPTYDQTAVKPLQDKITVLERNNAVLQRRVEEQDKEIQARNRSINELRSEVRRLERVHGTNGHLTQRIEDALPQEDWAKLMQSTGTQSANTTKGRGITHG